MKYPFRNWALASILALAVGALIYALINVPTLATQKSPAVIASPNKRVVSTVYDPAQINWNYDFSMFKNGPLPANDWNFEQGNKVASYNSELQTYTNRQANVRVQDGILVIDAHKDNINDRHYSSARINTRNHFSFTYGRLEVTMKIPAGRGTWPAAWLMPRDNKYSASALGVSDEDRFAWAVNGEIDIVESIGRLPGQNIPAAHSYSEFNSAPTYTPAYVPTSSSRFHTYGVIKTPDSITFTLDGKPYAQRLKTSNNPLDWPYDQPYYLIINLAIGGEWAGAEGIDEATSPWLLEVKNISYTKS